jgi:CDP-4-dehydro-6-deoxyglucose reductase
VFIAWNEGFASIKSLLQHAMSIETAERIDLYWAAPQRGHYQDNVCRAWADALDNLYYHPLPADTSPADLIEALQSQNPDWGGSDVYIAAPAAILDALKMAATERGLASGDWNIEVVL